MSPDERLASVLDWVVAVVEAAGALVVVVGAVVALVRFVTTVRRPERFVPIRLDLGRFLVVGIEFQLAGDLLRTAVAPSFEEIGQLAGIVAVRTALRFFLRKEIHDERRDIAGRAS